MTVEINDEDVVWRELDGEVIILNLATGCYYGLDGSANDMWRLLAEHGSIERVLAILADDYDVPAAQLSHDLNDLVQRLAERALVRLHAA